jgi:hypothetical protein
MKNVAAYYLLIFYGLAVCKPVLPLVHDMFAHAFWQAEHIATVHVHHGALHAESEMADGSHEHGDQNTSITQTAEPVSIHTPSNFSYSYLFFPSTERDYPHLLYYLSTAAAEENYPPPRC